MGVKNGTNIYLVETGMGRRFVVLAASSKAAAEKVGGHIADSLGMTGRRIDQSDFQVGRLGAYEPGIEGARLAASSPAGNVLATDCEVL